VVHAHQGFRKKRRPRKGGGEVREGGKKPLKAALGGGTNCPTTKKGGFAFSPPEVRRCRICCVWGK